MNKHNREMPGWLTGTLGVVSLPGMLLGALADWCERQQQQPDDHPNYCRPLTSAEIDKEIERALEEVNGDAGYYVNGEDEF